MTTKANNTRIWHAHYTTTIQCVDGIAIPADLRICSLMNDVLHANDTVAFVYARAHLPNNYVAILDASHVIPCPDPAGDGCVLRSIDPSRHVPSSCRVGGYQLTCNNARLAEVCATKTSSLFAVWRTLAPVDIMFHLVSYIYKVYFDLNSKEIVQCRILIVTPQLLPEGIYWFISTARTVTGDHSEYVRIAYSNCHIFPDVD
jgi:hypothetical protein